VSGPDLAQVGRVHQADGVLGQQSLESRTFGPVLLFGWRWVAERAEPLDRRRQRIILGNRADRQLDELVVVDTVSSLASIDFRMDEWRVDLVICGSQKGLMLPPGLGILGSVAARWR
jgi:hypothetical protein